jgi:hypothetical protein
MLLPLSARAQDAAGAKADVAPATWADADSAILYAEISRPAEVLDRLTSDRVGRLVQVVPAARKALEGKQLRELRQVAKFVAVALDTTPLEGVRTLTGGGATLIVEGETKPDRVYLIVKPTDPAFLERAHNKLVELARADAEGKGDPDPVKEGDYKGFHGYSIAKNEAHAIIDGRLIIASGNEAMKTLIDRMTDPSALKAKLSDDATWKARRDAAGKDATGWAYVRMDRLREIDPNAYAPERIDAGALFIFGPWAEAVRHGDWAGLTLRWTDDALAADLALNRPEKGYSEAMAGFIPPKGRGAVAPLNPPNMVASATLWRDLTSIWDRRADIFPPEQQAGLAQLDTTAGTFFGGRDFGSGVLGALGHQWRLVATLQDETKLDPKPDLVLPAFALVLDLSAEDPDFAVRLQAAFQSFIGLANLGAAQTKAPPLMLGSEDFNGLRIATAKYLPAKDRDPSDPVHERHNFTPSAVQVGDHFVLSSTLGLAKDLATELKNPPKAGADTLLMNADGAALAKLIDQNRERLVQQNILEKGNSREAAEGEIGLLEALATYLGQGSLTAAETDAGPTFHLKFKLGQP